MPEANLDARIEQIPERADSVRQRIVAGEDFFVAECGDRIVGMAVCKASRNPDYPLDGEIQAIYILKEYQGRRIG